MDWINAELLPEHIVVRSLEEDIFDGLILHHLFRKLLLSAPGSPRGQSGPAWGSFGALRRALGRRLQDRPTIHGFLSSCHGGRHEGASWGLYNKGINPIPESSVFMGIA